MQHTHPFTVYNASAGSGKTYTLVKEYVKVLLQSNQTQPYRYILAITFTNKAVAEMKERIIDTLKQFANSAILKQPNTMFSTICDELQMPPQRIQQRSKSLLQNILHNYAAFDISTIDGFTHKLIRTFAFDLKLPLNFEVELDQDALLHEAVDSLISKAGIDASLTKTLIDFSIEKADDDKSWDISNDFYKIAKLLLNENDKPFIDKLKDKTLDDFNALRRHLKSELKQTETDIIGQAQNILARISTSGLEHADFSRGTLPNHFKKAASLNLIGLYSNKLEDNIKAQKGLYPKTLSVDKIETITALLPEIEAHYKTIKALVFHLKFLKSIYKNSTPLSVLNMISKALEELKEEQNKMLISEFNTIISKEIRAQSTPFIYERIGEKFKHYFIDEFQDTSVMQWKNLIPLLDNALSAEGGSVMLVGDAKQAIYRWRGGKAEQFIGLCNAENPFQSEKLVENLPSNYRSYGQIVKFNNDFFKFLAGQVFSNSTYEALYQNATQNITQNENGGYVEVSFLAVKKEDDRDDIFPLHVLHKIKACLENGYELKDICVLVRKKKEEKALAAFLTEQKDIPVISADGLLLQNSVEVRFINQMLRLLTQPQNKEVKIELLDYLTAYFNITDKHKFFTDLINLSLAKTFEAFEHYGIYLSANELLQLPLYDLCETIVRQFALLNTSDAYVQEYLDVVFEFSRKNGSDVSGFLDFFAQKDDKLSITAPKGQNALQIMTIHKAKGLEFPVIIFPYADLDIYREIEPRAWFNLDESQFNDFPHALLDYNKDFEYYGPQGKHIYNTRKSELELDNINLLYVALTRAIEQLYIISTKDVSAKGEVNLKKYSGLLIHYIQEKGLWNDQDLVYTFGNLKKRSEATAIPQSTEFQNEFISTDKSKLHIKVVTKSGYLWDTDQQEAIEKGNLIHAIMAQIKSMDDLDFAIAQFKNDNLISQVQASQLKLTLTEILEHPLIDTYYKPNIAVHNERDIISKNGYILRPDRLVFPSQQEVVIIDYKTGTEDKTHQQQLQSYQDILEDMGFTVKEKILIYINKEIKVKIS